jgi:hypothetical protein
MKIEKNVCNYQVTECDLKFGKQITLDGELLIPMSILDKIRAEIEQEIKQERLARSVFRDEEKDAVKAEQCTSSIFAYNNVIKLIDKYKAESEE